MSSLLREHQHELCDLDGNNGIVFGTDDTGYLTTARPVITAGDLRLGDVDRPQEDGRAMGRDYRGAKTFTFEMTVLTDRINHLGDDDPHRANLDALDALESRWTDPELRDSPQAQVMLRSCEGGVVSRCYGRPRRWDEAASKTTQHGATPVVADFALVDDCWYSDTQTAVTVGLVAPITGGLVAPLVAPLTTILVASAGTIADVKGNRSTWPVVEFHGPVIDPSLRIGDLTIGLVGALAYDQTVIIDPRPWVRTALRYPGESSVAGSLSAATPSMKRLRLKPGKHDVIFTGRDSTGTASALLRWRTARARP